MVDDDARSERAREAEPDRRQQDREQGPLDVLGRSTLVGGLAALPPPPTAAPPAGSAAGTGTAPPRLRPGNPGARKDRARPSTAPAPRSAPEDEALPSVFLEKLDEPAAPARADKPAKPAKSGRKGAAAEQREKQDAAPQEPEDRTSSPESTITLWGGMQSGKSTLLAALSRAVQDPLYGKWTIYPDDHVSQKFLGDLARLLYRERKFPNATLTEQRPVRFTLAGDLTGTRFSRAGRRLFRRGGDRGRDLTEFKVTVRDLPGEAFDLRSQTGAAYGSRLIKDLGASRAMVYVVDPVREWQVNGDDGPVTKDARQNADFFTDVLGGVATEINMRRERQGNFLPHSIAVCLAKFDDDRVFRFACEQGNVRVNPRTGQPEVMDAKRLFDGLCHAFPHGSLHEIRQQIEQFFAPERVGYFVCSAVGFWVDPERGFDFENPYLINHVEDSVRFVAPPRPVNVLEPFLFLRGFGPTQS
ncbi:hypothetical protein [Streptomyces sp. 6-11-2]|uniref:hypothetical protein n=1 Tax=Streptomyces sp. 6-11-2 TaxID=2585753 RepID=UPI001141C6A6|nr:hypothetical protein [Streptomyces sp. 6-11-2]GED89111.1 hypothetical protein TNCT6_61960 [Streptomyces sp. 6-11-2]